MTPLEAFQSQIDYCVANDAPITATILAAIAAGVTTETVTGAKILNWTGHPMFDALPLRITGGLHHLWRKELVPELAPIFDGTGEPAGNAALMRDVFTRRDAALLPWLDGPPQTNEPGRSATLMTGLLEIVARHGPKLEILEIGSSAGLNLLINRYRIDLADISIGPKESTVCLTPEWRGTPPPATPPDIVSIRGVDIAPVNATTEAGADRLLAYCWADHTQRVERLAHALALLRAHPPMLEAGDAPDWVEARLSEPQPEGMTRVVMHSIVWTYIAAEGQARITAAMEAAGAHATPERPLAWVRVEANRNVHQHVLTIRSWPGHSEPTTVARAHAHGFWVERL
jgi:hypothetical protein